MHHNPVTMGLGYSETYASNWVNCLERLPSDYSQLAFSVFNFDLLLLWNKKYKISVIALPIGPTAWLMLPPFCWPAACECRNSFQDELPKAFLFSPTLRFISFFVFFCCFILLNTSHVVNFVTLLLAPILEVKYPKPCVNGDWLCQRERATFDPHRIHILWPITKKFVASDYARDPYGCGKFGATPFTGASGQMREI